MSVLIVEDDEFKALDVSRVLLEVVPNITIIRAFSVTSALRHINSAQFSLIILDMSLPTFDLSGPGGGGSPQGQGGLEVLRLARRLGRRPPFLIVTQYPDIEVNRKDISLHLAPKSLRALFGIDVRACIRYEFDSDAWRLPLRTALSEVFV